MFESIGHGMTIHITADKTDCQDSGIFFTEISSQINCSSFLQGPTQLLLIPQKVHISRVLQ